MLQKSKKSINSKSIEGINKNLLDIVNIDINIGRNWEKYDRLSNARDFYKYAKQGLNEIIILRINKYKKETVEKKDIILLENSNKQLFEEIKKESKKEKEITENINRVNEKIKNKERREMKQEENNYLELLLREDII